MRKVKIYKHAQVEVPPDELHSFSRKVWQKVDDGFGLFHQWGISYEEFEGGPWEFSTAIVERPDGSIVTPPAHMIEFIEPADPECNYD